MLRDEGEAYAQRLSDEGVNVELELYPGQMHGFLNMFNILPTSAQLISRIAEQTLQHAQQPAAMIEEAK